MKKATPTAEQMESFTILRVVFVFTAAAAFMVWELQDFAASFAAEKVRVETTLRTTTQSDDARVTRAFEAARREAPAEATVALVPEATPGMQTRDAVLSVTAAAKSTAQDTRERLVTAMQASYKAETGEELFELNANSRPKPVPDGRFNAVKTGFRVAAALILLAGLVRLLLAWRKSALPKVALVGILGAALTFWLTGEHEGAAPFWKWLILLGPPLGLLALVGVLSQRVRRAKHWREGTATVLSSKLRVERHRFAGEPTRVRNVPEVEYEFDADGQRVRGSRIGLGFGHTDDPGAIVARYAPGAKVPVFFDPAKPDECTLERNAPVGAGCLWSGVAVVGGGYFFLVGNAMGVLSTSDLLARSFPGVHHPLAVLVLGVLGVLALIASVQLFLRPQRTAAWKRTRGVIVSSKVEAYQDTDPDGYRGRTLHRPVTEYTYEIGGQTYHGSTNSGTGLTISAGEDWAERQAARWRAEDPVDVYYDPAAPSNSSLDPRGARTNSGLTSLIVGVVLLAAAWFLATR